VYLPFLIGNYLPGTCRWAGWVCLVCVCTYVRTFKLCQLNSEHQIWLCAPSSVISRPTCFSTVVRAAAGRWAQHRSSGALWLFSEFGADSVQIYLLTYLLTIRMFVGKIKRKRCNRVTSSFRSYGKLTCKLFLYNMEKIGSGSIAVERHEETNRCTQIFEYSRSTSKSAFTVLDDLFGFLTSD